MELKKCTRCNRSLILEHYDINDYHKDGSYRLYSICKHCRSRKFKSRPLVIKLLHQIQISHRSCIKRGGNSLKRLCTITKEELQQLIESQTKNGTLYCAATGVILRHELDTNPLQPSIDRIDCSKGYEIKNIRVVACAYNLMRRTWDDNVAIGALIEMAKALDKNRSS
jgi:hypothetical protein